MARESAQRLGRRPLLQLGADPAQLSELRTAMHARRKVRVECRALGLLDVAVDIGDEDLVAITTVSANHVSHHQFLPDLKVRPTYVQRVLSTCHPQPAPAEEPSILDKAASSPCSTGSRP